MRNLLARTFFALTLLPGLAHAGLIAQFDFDAHAASDSSASSVNYSLATTGNGARTQNNAYYSDGNASNHLSILGPGGMQDWTVSLWVNTSTADQGTFRGIFSNNNHYNTAYSWQLDSHNGQYRLLSKQNGNSGVVLGDVSVDQWQHIFVQKFNGNDARLFFNGQFIGTTGFNPGGLQNFRIGTNRFTNSAFTGLIDNIQIWDDSTVSAADVFVAGRQANPVNAPATILLLMVGLIALVRGRNKQTL